MIVKGIEHYDDFDGEGIFWAELSDLPEEIQDEARRIDKENYIPDGFGMCVGYDAKTKNYRLVTGEEDTNVYYVNNDGDKVWFRVETTEEFMNEVFSACEKDLSNKQ